MNQRGFGQIIVNFDRIKGGKVTKNGNPKMVRKLILSCTYTQNNLHNKMLITSLGVLTTITNTTKKA